MELDLRKIIDVPGEREPFHCELSEERVKIPQIIRFSAPPVADGEVKNNAGALSLAGVLRADMICLCDRCGREFPLKKELKLNVPIVQSETEAEDPEAFALEGDCLDLSDVLESCFILSTDMKFLCSGNCKGLCPKCGRNLNEGPCGCLKDTDPRLAVLEQLLDKEQ